MSKPLAPNIGISLVRIHKVVTRALAVSIKYIQNQQRKPEQQGGFRQYERAMAIVLYAHHKAEDEIIFPFLQKKDPEGPYAFLTEQHQEIGQVIKKIENWLEMGGDAWEPSAIDRLELGLLHLNNLWHPHIAIEEQRFGPWVAAKLLTLAENTLLDEQMASFSQQHALPAELVLPFLVLNLETQDRVQFARSLPAVVIGQLVPVTWKPVWEPMQPFLLN